VSGRLEDLLQIRPDLLGRPQVVELQRGHGGDHHQRVVKVVRDAAREPPDRLHLLRLAQLLLALA